MKIALGQARNGRMHILGEMAKALTEGRTDVSSSAPKITTISVPKEKIRDVIGQGGKVIREIVEYSGAKIDINDDGTIMIAASSDDQAEKAIERIRGIVAEPEVGHIYNGKVVKTADFGRSSTSSARVMVWCTSPSWHRAASPRRRTWSSRATK